MNTFITQDESASPTSITLNKKKHRSFRFSPTSSFTFFLSLLVLMAWTVADVKNPSPPAMALEAAETWNQLSSSQRQTLSNGGSVANFNLGICESSGQAIFANISSAPAAGAPNSSYINARPPRRWGASSFYLARQNMGGAGVEYCFELSTPTAISIDSREHAYFSNFENITIDASNSGSPINLIGEYPTTGDPFPAQVNGSGTTTLNFNANGKQEGGLWWSASSNGQMVTNFCIQYFTLNSGELPTVEPFRLLLDGAKCVADSPMMCNSSGYISRWNRLSSSERNNLDNGIPINDFNTGFCDETGDPIHFIEISSSPASSAPFSGLNNREPRPYGKFSLDNGREYIGMGGNTYCFTLDEARPMRVNSKEHSFMTAFEQVKVSAFLGADPVLLTNLAGAGTVTPAGIIYNGVGTGWWEASSQNFPVSQVCVEFVNLNGTALGREPFALEICAERCVFDDHFACSQNPLGTPGCGGLPDLKIEKSMYTINEYGLNACENLSGGIELAEFMVEIEMENLGSTVKELWLEDDLLSYFGAAYIDTVTAPEIIFSSASGTPEINPFYDGRNHTNIFVPQAGFLQNDQKVTVAFTVKLDLNSPGAYPNLVNRAYGGGIANGGVASNDLSGGLSSGDGWPTLVPNMPVVSNSMVANDLTLEATLPNYMNGIDSWLANNGGAEFSVSGCSSVTWTNDYDQSLLLGQQPNWTEGCGQITGSIEVTFVATNSCGHVFTTCATFTLEDTKGPSCLKPEDLVLNCADPSALDILEDWLNYVNGNWTDLSHPVTFTNDFMGLTPGACSGDPILVTWTATDACGNESYFDATLTVVDNTAPVIIGVPPNTTVQYCDDLPDPANVTATDGCDLDVEVVFSESTMGSGCNVTVFREWTATDDCGNSVSGSQTITVTDDINPELIGVPPSMSAQCMGDVPPVPTVTATDNCDDDVDISYGEMQTGSGCNLILTRTWTATDDCGNVTSASQTISLGDTEFPVLSGVPVDLSLNCEDDVPTPTTVTADDNCDDNLDVNFEETTVGDNCNLTITRKWTATDDCGNATTEIQVITISDDTDPVLVGVPADLTVICPDIPGPSIVTATDNCDTDVTVSFMEEVIGGPCPAPSQIIRTWTATDDCGNEISEQQLITVEEMLSEIIFTFVPPDVTATCDENPMFGVPIAETTCPAGGLSLSFEDEVISTGDCSQPFSVIRTWTAHDDCGNLEQVSQTLNIGPDTEAPIFDPTNPTSITVDCGGDVVFPDAFDNCGPTELTYEDTNVSGDCAIGFMFTRTWTATDLCGNTSTFSQEVTTNPDTSPPVFTFVPFDQFFDCDEPIIFPDPVAIDNCSDVTITYQDSIIGTGDCNEVNGVIYGYDIVRTWTATDECGNSTTAVTEAWVLPGFGMGNLIAFSYMPDNQLISCGEPMPFGEPVCHSVCSEVTLTYEDEFIVDCDNGHTVVRTWTATDDCGSSISASQTVTYETDSQGPIFTSIPPDGTFSCNGGSTPVFGMPTVEDNCIMGLDVQFSHTDTWQNLGGCDGETVTRTWTAVDACGNESTASQTMTLTDDQAPVFTIVPADQTISCGEVMAFGSVAASDNCSTVNVTFEDEMAIICEGSYSMTRTWTATDDCGNENTASQTITVEDTEAPVFMTNVFDLTIECGEPITFAEVEAVDGCSSVNITFEDEASPGCEGSVTRTWTATDACGHSTQLSQTIYIIDTQAPIFNGMPTQLSMSIEEFADWQIPAGTASDCGAFEIEMDALSVSSCDEVSHTYVYSATDACGNEAEHVLTVLVYDAVFSAEMNLPVTFECGNTHELTVLPEYGMAPYSYEWEVISGGGWEIISGNETPTVNLFAGEGSAEVSIRIIDAIDCQFEELVTVECSEVSTTSSVNVNEFKLAPNPAVNSVTVSFTSKKSGDSKLLVINALGQVVVQSEASVQIGNNEQIVNTMNLPAGTFNLQLQLGDEIVSGRFVKL